MNKPLSSGIDLTKGGITRNLIILSLPIMLSNFMQTVYNLTDMLWLGRLGEAARGAVSVVGMTFPLIFFLSSFGFGFAVAGTALVARMKGAGREDEIRRVVSNLLALLALFTIFFISFGLFFIDDILRLMHTPAEIFEQARSYISIIIFGSPFMYIVIFYQSIAHGLGDTVNPMKVQIISVLINVVLDPLLIFGFAFVPRMEIVGAAYATFFSRFVAAVISVAAFKRYSAPYVPRKGELKPSWGYLSEILRISIPASLSQAMTSFGFLFLQGFVNSFGTVVMSIYSIGNRMTGFFMMPAMGISNALTAVVGQNLGAGKPDVAKKSLHRAMALVMAIMGVGAFLVFVYGAQLTRFFIADDEVVAAGMRMFRVTSIASFIFGIIFVFIGLFNGAGKTGSVFLFNVSRLWLFRIPMVYLLSGRLWGICGMKEGVIGAFLKKASLPLSEFPYDALWWSMVISNTLSALWAFILYLRGGWLKRPAGPESDTNLDL